MIDLKNQIECAAKTERSIGTKVLIDQALPFISIDSPNGDEYVFQGDEALALLDEMSSRADAFGVSIEDALLHSFQGW